MNEMKVDKWLGHAGLRSEHDKKINKMKLVKDFWSRLSKQVIDQLYSVYKIDFEMFQYKYPQAYINMGH